MGKTLLINQCGDGVDPLGQSLIDEGHDVGVANTLQAAHRLMTMKHVCGGSLYERGR